MRDGARQMVAPIRPRYEDRDDDAEVDGKCDNTWCKYTEKWLREESDFWICIHWGLKLV